jgi:hypothetical protein
MLRANELICMETKNLIYMFYFSINLGSLQEQCSDLRENGLTCMKTKKKSDLNALFSSINI